MIAARVSTAVVAQQKVAVRARAAAPRSVRVFAEAEEAEKAEEKPWAPPTLDADTPSPIFGGSTGE